MKENGLLEEAIKVLRKQKKSCPLSGPEKCGEESKSKIGKIDPDADPDSEALDENAIDPSKESQEDQDQNPPLEGLAAEDFEVLKKKLNKIQLNKALVEEKARDCSERRLKRQEAIFKLYMQRIQVNPGDAKGNSR